MKKTGIVLFLLAVLAGVGFWIGRPYYQYHFATLNLPETEQLLYIPSGASLEEVSNLVETATANGLDQDTFLSFAGEFGLTDDKIEPGKYLLTDQMKIKNLIYGLKNGNQEIKDVRVTFNNCTSIEDMAGKVAPDIEADSADLVAYIKNPATIDKYGFNEATIVALFLQDTYEVGEWDFTAEEFVRRMADEYKKFWNAERKAKAGELNMSQSEVATLASILEAEQGVNTQEWKTIAGLYLNRLKIGMLLQSDPTAKFCWGDELDGVNRLLNVHMQIDCPYNTYKYAGLPPGPIRMPSKKAMDAVLNAENHNYLYMCARPDNSGLHNFAKSYAQHLNNANKYRAYLRSINL